MIKNELKALWDNKLLLVVLLVIMLIPSIYAGLFLASMWDPYGELEYLPVAVVDHDQPVEYNDKELAIGKNLTDSLKDNDAMAFSIVDDETAEEGLKNGTYYMIVTIPENFSANATTLTEDEPKQMMLEYQTNPGKNYIAMKMSESALKEIDKNITEEITHTYAESVFDSIQEIGDGFGDAVDGARKMIDGEDQLRDGNQEITDNLDVLATSTLTFKEGSDTFSKGLSTYFSGVKTLDKGIHKLQKGTDQIADEAGSGADTLAEGAKKLNDSLGTYTEGVASAKSGSDELTANSTALNEGLASVSAGTDSLKSGSTQILNGLKQMRTSLDGSLTKENVTQIQTAAASLPVLDENIQKLNAAVNGDGKSSGIDMSGMTQVLTGVGGNIQSAGADIQSSANTMQASAVKVREAYAAVSAVVSSENLTAVEKKTLQTAMAALYDSDNETGDATAYGNIMRSLGGISSAGDQLTAAGSVLTSAAGSDLSGQVEQLKSSVSQLAAASKQLLPASGTTLTSLLKGMQSVQTGLIQTKEADGASGLIEGMTSLDEGITALQTGINGEKGLKAGLTAYTNGVSSLNTGLATLTGYNESIQEGMNTLATGADTFATGLHSGVSKLTKGAAELQNGSDKLVSNQPKLSKGAGKLSDGAIQIADGAGKLRDGSKELGGGLSDLHKGTMELKSALQDGKEEIRDSAATDATLDMFANPVGTEGSEITTVKNNGHAMAAYMMTVGLWVGCLAFCLMYTLSSYTGELKSGIAWWGSKAVILYPLAILMSGILVIALHIFNGFSPESMGRTFLVAMVTAVAFMSIMYFFNLLLGKIGSFLMLIFMVLQLAGSAGTYPVEISGSLVAAIHKYVPFTYTVDAFRSAISGGESIAKELSLLLILALVFSGLTVAVFEVRARRIRKSQFYIYEWIEEKGLA